MYHAACKVEFNPFNRSYSQLTFFNFYTSKSKIYTGIDFFKRIIFLTPGFNQRKPGLEADSLSTRPQSYIAFFFFGKYISIFMRDHFFFDDTRIRTSEGHQNYKRTVYLLDHNMSQQQCVSTSTIFLQIYINFFMRIIFVSYDPWIQPTKTRLGSGQSIY